jgi:hypothetical protein
MLLTLYTILCFLNLSFNEKQIADVYSESSCCNLIIIKGETNVNSFECYYKNNVEQLIVLHDKLGEPFPGSKYHKVKFALNDFIMDNSLMKSDFLELMKADMYPEIEITVVQEDLLSVNKRNHCLNAMVTLAGVTKNMDMKCAKIDCSNGKTLLKGYKEIELDDFGIIPKNYFGFIKIKNTILINFEFIISE